MKGENRLLKQSEIPAAREGRSLRAFLKGALCGEMGGRGIIFHKIGDVGEPLPPMPSQRDKPPRAWLPLEAGPVPRRTAIRLAMDTKAMPMHVTPAEHKLQRGLKRGQGHSATDENPAPDQGADALQD